MRTLARALACVVAAVGIAIIGIAEDREARERGNRRSRSDRAMGWTV